MIYPFLNFWVRTKDMQENKSIMAVWYGFDSLSLLSYYQVIFAAILMFSC